MAADSQVVTTTLATPFPVPPLQRSERYAMRAVERETLFGRASLDAFDQLVADAWYDLGWGL
jgi:hypothetical protein